MNSQPLLPSSHRTRGLTLIELMVTVSILAILMAVAIPSFQSMIASSNLTTATNDLMATLAQARSNAIRRGGRVTVCKSANSTQCTTTGDWQQGWIMFNDNDHSATVETGETVIFSATALTNGIVIKVKGSLDYVSYASDGQSKLANGGFLAGTFRICSTASALSNDKRARNLVLSSTGRVIVQSQANIAATCPAPT